MYEASKLISGRHVAATIEGDALERSGLLHARHVEPRLAVVYMGEHKDAARYRKTIGMRAERLGLAIQLVALPPDAPEQALRGTLQALNGNAAVHGVLVQNPLPPGHRLLVGHELDPRKDVEGLTRGNLGDIVLGNEAIIPCTPGAILALIESQVSDLTGTRVVLVNRSATIGRPLSQLLLNKRATVTVCSSATVDLASETQRAEILIVAIGRPRAIGASHIGQGAIVIDAGINADPSGNGVCGDIDTEAVLDRVAAITPVPGGVGPVTTALLLANAIALAERLQAPPAVRSIW